MPTVEKAPTVAITKRDGLLLGSACTVSALLRILLSHRALGADGTRALRALLVVSPEND